MPFVFRCCDNRNAFIFSFFGGACAIPEAILFVLVPALQFVSPGAILGIGIIAALKYHDKNSKIAALDVILILFFSTLGWYIAAVAGSNVFGEIFSFLKDEQVSLNFYFVASLSGIVSGFIGATFLVLAFNRIYKINYVLKLFLKPVMVGATLGAVLLPIVAAEEVMYIILFLPWQAAVLYIIVKQYEDALMEFAPTEDTE